MLIYFKGFFVRLWSLQKLAQESIRYRNVSLKRANTLSEIIESISKRDFTI